MRRRLWLATVCCVLLAGLIATAGPASAAAPKNITDLGSNFWARGINGAGDVVVNDGVLHTFVWNPATGMTQLGLSGVGPTGINNAGEIIGQAGVHAIVWDAVNGKRDLGTLGGPINAETNPADINELGQVVGTSYTAIPGHGQHAFLWDATNGMIDLGTLGGTSSVASGINDLGQVVGSAATATGAFHGFVWDPVNGMTDLTAAGCGCAQLRSINNAGQIVGVSSPGLPHAIVWDPVHGTTDLGTLSGGFFSFPAAINNDGEVVGESTVASSAALHAFIWDPVRGMRDLGHLGSSSLDSGAVGIDDNGSKVIGFSGGHNAVIWGLPSSPPSVSVGSASIVEGRSGAARRITFSVTLSEPSTKPVSVDYAVVGDGSASQDSDFVAADGRVTFAVNSKTGLTPTTRFISVRILPDVAEEGDETFHVVLSNPIGYFGLGSAIGTGTILDGDPSGPLSVGVGDASGWEGHLGAGNTVKVPVTLSEPAPSLVSVLVTVTSADATSGVDYKGTSRTLTFKAGQSAKSVAIKLFPDLLAEGAEHVSVQLTNPTGGLSLGPSTGTVTILDDD